MRGGAKSRRCECNNGVSEEVPASHWAFASEKM
jgi:hypothetical protein